MRILIYKSLVAFAIGAVSMLALSFTVYRKSYYYKKAQVEAQGVRKKPGILSPQGANTVGRLCPLRALLARHGEREVKNWPCLPAGLSFTCSGKSKRRRGCEVILERENGFDRF